MKLLDWFNKKIKDEESNMDFMPDEEYLLGLNLKQALDAHNAWKSKLQKILDGINTEDMDVATTSQDDKCVLGQWIHSEGKQMYGHLPEYASLKTSHAAFHLCAGEILNEHQNGNAIRAAQMLHTQFRTASNKNQLELVRLFTITKAKQ